MPCDYTRYHPDWHRISRDIRQERAGNKCERCGVPNYTVRLYEDDRIFQEETGFAHYKQAREVADALYVATESSMPGNVVYRATVTVLTVAHLDHDIENNDPANLAALCQGCHLGHDRRDNWDKRRYGPTGQFHNQTKLDL